MMGSSGSLDGAQKGLDAFNSTHGVSSDSASAAWLFIFVLLFGCFWLLDYLKGQK